MKMFVTPARIPVIEESVEENHKEELPFQYDDIMNPAYGSLPDQEVTDLRVVEQLINNVLGDPTQASDSIFRNQH